MRELTKTQTDVLNCIKNYIEKNGYSPSVRDICSSTGLSSPSSVHNHINTLAKYGYIERSDGRNRSIRLTEAAKPTGIPLIGTVAAGYPILAVEDALGYIQYDPERSGEYFALNIKGESMINAGILDGDIIIVRKQETAMNGEIVVALIGDEATCKRLSRKAGHIWLFPENDDFQPIDGNQASILGKVTAVIRNY